jgi:hypothetical protein
MADDITTSEPSSLARQLDDALTALERALAEAGSAIAAVRGSIANVVALEEWSHALQARVSELEAVISRASESLLSAHPRETPAWHLRPVTSWEADEDEESTRVAAPAASEIEDEPAASVTRAPATRCLRLDVSRKLGSLDLKLVDSAVNESPGVADVALLDYDGQQATLRLWIAEDEDPDAVCGTLLKSLRSRLGGESLAEVRIEFEEESAA